ncbi:MAG: ABC transporter ATP-binding protein [Nitrososphaeraceae archaeon]|nr:ABC transporter ATP-binding protein [Nitrososphaeraceae archaeon]
MNLRIENLTRNYGSVKALDNFSLEVKSGEFMALLGPSGCGKTTVVRCIAGLINPSVGQIYIGDQLVNQLPPKDRDVAMVFQNYALYPHMSVYDNIAFPLKMRKIPKQQIKDKVKNISQLLEIESFLSRKPKELSGGQMQRVALGRALVREPKIFLMDEPLSNLDAKLRTYMRAEIKKLQKKISITTLYITHDQLEAISMADRIAVMNSGLVQQIGTAEKIYREPANTFVADFVGSPSMNFLKLSIIESDYYNDNVAIESNGRDLQIPINKLPFKLPVEKNIIIGIRPRDILFLTNEDFNGIKVKGKISFTELLGDDSLVEIKIGIDESIKVTTTDISLDFTIGKDVTVGMPYDKIHFFEPRTGNRLVGLQSIDR